MIKLKNVVKKFEDQLIHQDINLEFEQGKLTTLLGANGSGKSTLLKMIAGIEHPTEGSITIDGESVHEFNF